jgi:hypothetical protein
MTTAAVQPKPDRARGTTAAYLIIAALTAFEIFLASAPLRPAARVVGLCLCLLQKVDIVLASLLRPQASRIPRRLLQTALLMTAVFAAVLMLEAAFQARTK